MAEITQLQIHSAKVSSVDNQYSIWMSTTWSHPFSCSTMSHVICDPSSLSCHLYPIAFAEVLLSYWSCDVVWGPGLRDVGRWWQMRLYMIHYDSMKDLGVKCGLRSTRFWHTFGQMNIFFGMKLFTVAAWINGDQWLHENGWTLDEQQVTLIYARFQGLFLPRQVESTVSLHAMHILKRSKKYIEYSYSYNML